MDTVQALGSAMGLGLLAGIRLYATVFALGFAIRMGWFHLSATFSHLDVLAQTPVLILSGAACAIEFFADKIPWLDSIWDSIHTFIRPIGAAVLGATALGSFDPTARTLLALLCGGVAFTGHTTKAATRLVANHSPEPFSNSALSFAEDLFVPAGLWVAFQHPAIAVAGVGAFLLLFVWLSPKLFRLLHVSWTALRSLVNKWMGGPSEAVDVFIAEPVGGTVRRALEELPYRRLPEPYVRKLAGMSTAGVHCVATRSVRGFKNSSGYLCPTPMELVFIAQRTFRLRTYRIPWSDLQEASLSRGSFLDPLVFKTDGGELGFDVFKAKHSHRRKGLAPALDAS
jgi:uncharacterized membrane protein